MSRTDRQHLLECAARNLLMFWSLPARQKFLLDWEKRHGRESVELLKQALTEQHARYQAMTEQERAQERRRLQALSHKRLHEDAA